MKQSTTWTNLQTVNSIHNRPWGSLQIIVSDTEGGKHHWHHLTLLPHTELQLKVVCVWKLSHTLVASVWEFDSHMDCGYDSGEVLQHFLSTTPEDVLNSVCSIACSNIMQKDGISPSSVCFSPTAWHYSQFDTVAENDIEGHCRHVP